MEKDTANSFWDNPQSDELGYFDIEFSQSSSITQGAQFLDEITLEDLQDLSDTEEEGKQNQSQELDSVSSQGVDQRPSLPGKKRGRKMVLVAVLHETKPNHPSQTKSAPTSPIPSSISPIHNTIVSEDSVDRGREPFRTLSGCAPCPKTSTIWRRSFSDTCNPNSIPESPSHQKEAPSLKNLLWKRTKVVPSMANQRSLSWSVNEERATAPGASLTMKVRNSDPSFVEESLPPNESGGRLFQLKLRSSEGETDPNVSVKGYSEATNPSILTKQDTDQPVVAELPRQLAQAVYGMRIAQIGGFREIYQAMQFPPSIVTHANAFCRTFQFFRSQGVSCKVDIGYRYFVNEKEYLPEKGLLPGICTFNDPFAFYPHDHSGNVQGQLVARLPGNLHRARTTISQLKASEAAIYTAVECPLRRSFLQILSSPDQCLPLLYFDSHTVLDLYDNESMGNLVLHTYHQRLQKELDHIFNDGILTKVPFHLPSEHPDFQPI